MTLSTFTGLGIHVFKQLNTKELEKAHKKISQKKKKTISEIFDSSDFGFSPRSKCRLIHKSKEDWKISDIKMSKSGVPGM